MDRRSRRKFSIEFKSKVVLEVLRERSTIEELVQKYELHPPQINQWKKEEVSKIGVVFNKGKKEASDEGQL